jgi:hypothetical protein
MLVILSLHNRAMYWRLQRELHGMGIDLVIDRRGSERRSASTAAATAEGRHGDRRVNRIDERLRQFGWVVVESERARPPMDAERCAVCGTAILPDQGRYRPPAGSSHPRCYEVTRRPAEPAWRRSEPARRSARPTRAVPAGE